MPKMEPLRNCWYMAAWADEVGDGPFTRKILDEHILFYRLGDGSAVALSDRCPHRFAPLHLGRLQDDVIECPYHGLRFNAEGRCVYNPQGNGATPAAARLRRYPLIERYAGLWIWMGDPDLADAALLPDYPFMNADSGFACIRGYTKSNAHYELMSDNILDLSHVDLLHPTSLGCEATSKSKANVRREGDTVFCDRWMPNDRQGPLLRFLFEREDNTDAWLDVRWDAPALMLLTFGMTDVGAPRSAGREIPNVHFMTPESERSTHYFWASGRDFRVDDVELSALLHQGITSAFDTEDKPMVEAQQEMMGVTDLWSLKPILLAGDAAPVLARRILQALAVKERSGPSPAERELQSASA